MALFPNFAERPPTTLTPKPIDHAACDRDESVLLWNPSARVMPGRYFMFMEIQFGECGPYVDTDGGATSYAIGFR